MTTKARQCCDGCGKDRGLVTAAYEYDKQLKRKSKLCLNCASIWGKEARQEIKHDEDKRTD